MSRFSEQLLDALGRDTRAYREADHDEPAVAALGAAKADQGDAPPERGTRPDPAGVSLTQDEIQLLAEIATGVTTDVAARRLELSARTLRRQLRSICDKLGVNTPIEAVVWAARKRLI
ncbi:LuxR C-terminal-related transcriptional regulator [Nocardiopsis sp. CNT-189]|uniref:LuxR C-terminal-related transcriptional regulator n=1 Tax=Nocardiopsis oceanisediminis TaxID=2816862 RepID=UPI003B3ACE36